MRLKVKLSAEAAVCAALVLFAVVLFLPVGENGFLLYDDGLYVVDNEHVLKGLTGEGVRWAFTSTHASNWHPLTWLSHMADVQFFGPSPGAHHLVNLFLHAVNTLLLFLFLSRATGALWRSAFVAALFCCHPLHVESVAWIAERKDVLSTAFFLMTLGFYARYCRNPSAGAYVGVFLCMAMSLMSKPMYVTLPLLLLLLDFWPFGRRGMVLLKEKAPLFALSLLSAYLTLAAQSAGGAVTDLAGLSLTMRLANSIHSLFRYLWMAVWPAGRPNISPFHAHPTLSAPVLLSALAVAAVSILVWRGSRRCPALAVGWGWFIVILLPVLGIVQVGAQAMADRYTYMSYTGLFVMLSWGSWEWMPRRRGSTGILAAAAVTAVLLLALATRNYIGYWRDSSTLFTRALAVTSENWLAEYNMGIISAEKERYEDAAGHYTRALEILPSHAESRTNLGNLLLREGRVEEAVAHLREAHRAGGGSASSAFNLANALAQGGSLVEALRYYGESVQMDPLKVAARDNYGIALARLGRHREAAEQFRISLDVSWENAVAHHYLGEVLHSLGRKEEAALHRSEAARLRGEREDGPPYLPPASQPALR